MCGKDDVFHVLCWLFFSPFFWLYRIKISYFSQVVGVSGMSGASLCLAATDFTNAKNQIRMRWLDRVVCVKVRCFSVPSEWECARMCHYVRQDDFLALSSNSFPPF